ncbi:DUF1398 domain-containing protein [Pedobacter ginsengisoli]|uniref:DUF1398 domain-containing protein n=1 Tax=Pedobacter ginsengisoli TaxID=363852 RepID=UPI00254ACEBC|nr:DUF1398 family protein [Pedobacter ginsengisoli]
MFTLQQMRAAHAKVKSGADFPAYVQEIKQLGLLHYEFMVSNGQTIYHGADDLQFSSDPSYTNKTISGTVSPQLLQQIIVEHQQGKSDFLTLCQQVANAGVAKWIVDTQAMVCRYYDLSGNEIINEPIPDNGY